MYNEGQTCPICATGTLSRTVIDQPFEYKGRTINISDFVVFKCSSCKEELVDKESMRRTEKTIRDFQRSTDGLLTSEEIKRGRSALGFTQEAFASLLGVGSKNFARYENGQVTQSKSMDNLLRIIFEYPFTLDAISRSYYTVEMNEPIQYSTKAVDNDIMYNFSALGRLRA